MIHCANVSKVFNNFTALQDVDITIEKHGCYGLLGENGAGKTTLMRILAGLSKTSGGNVEIAGVNPYKDQKKTSGIMGYLPQHPSFYGYMNAEEWLLFVGELFNLRKEENKKMAEKQLKQWGLWESRHRKISGYSGGMKQRLGLAQAFMNNPEILLLDEPVSALDPVGRHDVLAVLEELKSNHIILMSTHILDDIEKLADSILIMNKGKIVLTSKMDDLVKENTQSVILFEILEPISSLTDRLAAFDWVEDAEQNNLQYRLTVNNLPLAKRELPQFLAENKVLITSYTIERLSLEDVFLKVVKKNEHV